jgi:hypothetical protein
MMVMTAMMVTMTMTMTTDACPTSACRPAKPPVAM